MQNLIINKKYLKKIKKFYILLIIKYTLKQLTNNNSI